MVDVYGQCAQVALVPFDDNTEAGHVTMTPPTRPVASRAAVTPDIIPTSEGVAPPPVVEASTASEYMCYLPKVDVRLSVDSLNSNAIRSIDSHFRVRNVSVCIPSLVAYNIQKYTYDLPIYISITKFSHSTMVLLLKEFTDPHMVMYMYY